jgi:hypothetical protein
LLSSRNFRRPLTIVVALVVVGISLFIYRSNFRPSSPAEHGFTRAGVVDGDTLWVKYTERSDGRQIALQTTGRDSGLCNASGPATDGYFVCAGGAGHTYAFATLVPPGVARVEMATSSGVVNFTVLPPMAGTSDALAAAVIRGASMSPQFGSVTYYDQTNHKVSSPVQVAPSVSGSGQH